MGKQTLFQAEVFIGVVVNQLTGFSDFHRAFLTVDQFMDERHFNAS